MSEVVGGQGSGVVVGWTHGDGHGVGRDGVGVELILIQVNKVKPSPSPCTTLQIPDLRPLGSKNLLVLRARK